ncbi:Pantoate--beta-alanine ligase [Aphelenchoides bicaudatus]|nr:Pantoate--beta-alanine ligase [Aphelenchoides bicaudatus]
MPQLIRTIVDLRAAIEKAQQERLRDQKIPVALIPTMGALHDGHLALVDECGSVCPSALTIVSIFVNPRQFELESDDLKNYPRMLLRDLDLLNDKTDIVFAPSAQEMYPQNIGNEITVTAGPASAARFEGSKRVGHFDGVLTVVSKLFNIVQPDLAFFGQKDAEQVFLIKRMVQQLNYPIQIHVVPTVRSPNGLALSSRNQRLSDDERDAALRIPYALFEAQKACKIGRKPSECMVKARKFFIDTPDNFKLDYLVMVRENTLAEIDNDNFKGNALVLMAVWVGGTRLIDNILLEFK